MNNLISDQTKTKKIYMGFTIRFFYIVVICFTFLTGCLPVETAPVFTTPTFLSPSITIIPTFFTPTVLTETSTPTPIPQTPIRTPTKIISLDPTPIVLLGTIIDGTGAEPLEDAVIVIQNGYITAVGPRQEVEIPNDAHVFEFHNAAILPGFINAHVHTTYDPVLLEKWAQAGVTTVRDLGARYPFNRFSTRDKYNADPKLSTMIAAGPLITVAGGYPIVGNNFPSLVVTNPDHARREVTELISDGADVIKIVVDSGEGLPTLSLEKASAIVETAHQMNVPVAAHIGRLKDLKLVLDAGVDDFSHIVPEKIPEDVLTQIVYQNVYWIPTLETADGYDGGNILRFIEAGGQIALGNDSGMLPGIEIGMPLQEIEMLFAAGMSPMEIIVAATRNAAHVCNRDETLGTIEVGKTADILVVNGDPLESLQALIDVRLVIHQGVIIRDSTQE